MTDPASFTGTTGAGLYGAPPPTHKTRCANSNNPFGHSSSCPCRRAETVVQPVPVEDAEIIEFPQSPYSWFDGPEAA